MWEQIRANKRRSAVLLLALFSLLLVVGYAGGELLVGPGYGIFGIPVAIGVFAFQYLVYVVAGESILLAGSGAKEISHEDSPRLFNIVEEMKLASGLEHLPRVYLVDSPAPNAFAIGRKPENSAVMVTSGLLHRLNRDELQGVVAHETGHLKNRDVQFMTLAAVMLGSILILTDMIGRAMRNGSFSRTSSRSSSRSGGSGGGQAQLIIMLVAVLIIILSPILAQILYFATSRKREYLADACAAQYTRLPDGLASALEKISRASTPLAFATKATAPMFIVNPSYSAANSEPAGLFSTHPPTSERVKILRGMTGASYIEYNESYRAAKGNSVIGERTLRQSQLTSKRAAESEGPIESRTEARSTVHRLYGYIEIKCDCTMVMRVPEHFELDEVRCIRCGSVLPIPSVVERAKVTLERMAQQAPPASQADAPPLEYTRSGNGWETFRCNCGGTVQVGPAFSAPRVFCRQCGRQIQINPIPV